jgi:two-component system KDP operon response regulator KdpE
MRVALRHANDAGGPPSPSIVVGDLRLDLDARRVFVKDQEVHLTPIEYKLFGVLMKNAGRALTHRQLLKDVWGPSHVDQTQYLRVYMVQLRHKLEEEPARPKYLLTEPGVGYRLRDRL